MVNQKNQMVVIKVSIIHRYQTMYRFMLNTRTPIFFYEKLRSKRCRKLQDHRTSSRAWILNQVSLKEKALSSCHTKFTYIIYFAFGLDFYNPAFVEHSRNLPTVQRDLTWQSWPQTIRGSKLHVASCLLIFGHDVPFFCDALTLLYCLYLSLFIY